MTTTTTRRAILRGAAAAIPAAAVTTLPTLALGEPDPIFAAIEAQKAQYANANAGGHSDDEIDELADAEHYAFADLLKLTPTTVAGSAALLRFLGEYMDECGVLPFEGWHECDEAGRSIWSRIAETIEHAAVQS